MRTQIERVPEPVAIERPPRRVRQITLSQIKEVTAVRRLLSDMNISVPAAVGRPIGASPLPTVEGFPMRQPTSVPMLATPRRFPVAAIDFSRTEIVVPFGARYVNAATLKRMAGGSSFDQLLKKTAAGWTFVPDGARVDLTDGTQEFRLGQLTIFS